MAYTKTNWANGGTPPISAANLNNIENGIYNCDTAINSMATYSTSETPIGTWIDGKTIYRKVIDFGALPNATTKTINAGLLNVRILNMYGTAYDSAGATFPINTTRIATPQYAIGAWTNNAEGTITMDAGSVNRTSYTAYIIVEYIKMN